MYRSMLVPLDGSPFAEHALSYARPLARRSRAKIHLVLAHTPLAAHAAEMTPPGTYQQWEDASERRERTYLERVGDRLKEDGFDVDVELREGSPARALVERSREGVDLVVMATHGRGGVERLWLGSVADQLVRHSHVPVLLVRPAGTETPADERGFRHVLAATDGSNAAEAAVEHAVGIARLCGARLTLLRVVPMPYGPGSPYIPHAAEFDRDAVRRREATAGAQLRVTAGRLDTGSAVRTLVGRAYHPARGILDAAMETDADLIVLGTHRRLGLARAVLGSTADRVVRAATVPVLVVHAGDQPGLDPANPIVA